MRCMITADVSSIAYTIQLVLAPVFLLAGIGGILNVVASRLARVVDRVRGLEMDVLTADEEVRRRELEQLSILDLRIRICHLSIGLCTASALLVCLVVIVMFVAELVTLDFANPVALLFIGAMISLTAGLLLFLAEVTIATRFVRVSEQFVTRRGDRRR